MFLKTLEPHRDSDRYEESLDLPIKRIAKTDQTGRMLFPWPIYVFEMRGCRARLVDVQKTCFFNTYLIGQV